MRRSELDRFSTEESSSGSTLPFEEFNYLIPGPNGPVVSNIVENPARNYELETKRLKVAEKYLTAEEQKKIVEEAVKAEEDNFQTGQRFLKGFKSSYLSAQSGIQRMLGQDEDADDTFRYLNDPQKELSQRQLKRLAQKVAPEEAKKLEEELNTGFVGDFAEGLGQLSGQLAMTGTASAVNPVLGFSTLVGQVGGSVFEGHYQRSKQERLQRLFGEYSFNNTVPDKEELEQKLADINEQAKQDAFTYLPSAIPEVTLDALFLKGFGKLMKGSSQTADKIGTFTFGSLIEGGNEAMAEITQNFMVKNNINPEQSLLEGSGYAFVLGTLVGGTAQGGAMLFGEGSGAGEQSVLSDVNKVRRDIVKRLKADAKKGDQKAQEFLDKFNDIFTQQTSEATGGVVTSISGHGTTDGGMDVDSVLKEVQKLYPNEQTPIHILDSFDALKNHNKDLADALGKQDGIEGLYHKANNEVILFADQLKSKEDVKRVLRHELIGHMGNEAITGDNGKLFYEMIGREYFDTETGQDILKNYGQLDAEVLGKEIVARVSENPDLAPLNFKNTIVNKFRELTGNKVEDTPETDRLILNSIAVAEQVLNSPDVFNKVESGNIGTRVDAQEEEALASKTLKDYYIKVENKDRGDDVVGPLNLSEVQFYANTDITSNNTYVARGTGEWQPLTNGVDKQLRLDAFNESLQNDNVNERLADAWGALTFEQSNFRVKPTTTTSNLMYYDGIIDHLMQTYPEGTFAVKGETKFNPEGKSIKQYEFVTLARLDPRFNPLDPNTDPVAQQYINTPSAIEQRPPVGTSADSINADAIQDIKDLKYGEYVGGLMWMHGEAKGIDLLTDLFKDVEDQNGNPIIVNAPSNIYANAKAQAEPNKYIRLNTLGFETGYQPSGETFYQTVLDYADSAERIYIPDKDLSDINKVRSQGAMISSALKHGSTKHFIPHPVQLIHMPFFQDETTRDSYVWGNDFKEDLSQLLRADLEMVKGILSEKNGYEIDTLPFYYDFEDGKFYRGDIGSIRYEADFRKQSYRQEYTEHERGVGLRTLQRAIITQSILNKGQKTKLPELHSANQILASRSRKIRQDELKAGMTRDEHGNLYYKGRPPQDWTPTDFKEVGDLYGIDNFGPLTKVQTVRDPETKKTYKIPGGLDGKFTYYDLLWIKANQPTIENIGKKNHGKLTKKIAESLTPSAIDPVDQFNRLAFGFLSPNAPLLPNEFGVARIFARDKKGIQKLADLGKDYPVKGSKKEQAEWERKTKAKFDIGAEKDGGLGIGLTQSFYFLSNFARLYLKDPDFYTKKADESWGFFVDRLSSQAPGFGTKVSTFAGVWQDPANAMISAIDRHMANKFADAVLKKPALRKQFEAPIVKAFNDFAKTVDPDIPKVETLDDAFGMGGQLDPEKFDKIIGKALLNGMSSRNVLYKNAKGEVNKNVDDVWKEFKGFIEEPKSLQLMSDAYREALRVNEEEANNLGIAIFPAQWTLWDRIRQRVEPHEIMFPNLSKLPRMGREQIQETYNISRSAGYDRAPQKVARTNVAPSKFVYFSKKDSEPDPVTGLGKLTLRLQADESLPQQIRDNLDPEYTVQAHSEVLEQIKPWFGDGRINYEQKAKDLLVEFDQQNLTPEGKMLAGQILVKALGRQADAMRGRLGKKDKKGQLKFDGIVDTNKLDDLAISLATRLAEEGRTYGRAISILQEYGNLRGMALVNMTKKTLTNAVIEKVKSEGITDQQVNDLTEIIKVATEAGFDGISVEFLRKKAPDLVKIIEKQFAPSLWGAYRKDAVNKIFDRLTKALKQQGGSSGKTPLARFTNELVSEIQRRVNAKPGSKRSLRPKTEVLRDALLNAEKYKDVWMGLADKIRRDKDLTDADRAELQDFFGPIPEVSGQLVESTINERMKAFDVKLQKLVREHYSQKDKVGNALTKAIMTDLDLPADIASKMSMRLQSEFNRKMREEAKKQIDAFKKKTNAPKLEKKAKGLEDFVIEMVNVGAFDRPDVFDGLGKRMGIKGGFSVPFAKRIQSLAMKIQEAPEGFQRNDLVQDLLSEIQNKVEEGSKWSALGTLAMAIRQANLVSGVSTQLINLTSNLATMAGMQVTQAMRAGFNPNIMFTVLENMVHGLAKGKDEAGKVLLTGRGRRGFEMDKHAFDPILERKVLKGGAFNPYNYLKHVHRFMSGLDTMFRFTNIEGKASFLSAMEAKKKGLSGKALRDYVKESLKNTDGFIESAKAQATKEGLSGLDHRRRVNEIVEGLRDPEIKDESEQFGLRSTYQNVPEGLLGALASWVAQGAYPPVAPGTTPSPAKQITGATLQFFIPFIRVVANVQNMMFDYTPVLGAGRAVWHKYGKGRSVRKDVPHSEEHYQDMMARQLLGTALAGSLGYLFFREEDDEDNRMFDITGPGPLNLKKRNALIDDGWKPYTITWNGKQIGYKETPFGGFLAFMGGIKDARKFDDEQPTPANLATAGTYAFARLMFDQAFFKGVSDGFSIAKADQMSPYLLDRLVKGTPKQFLIPNLFNQVDNAIHNRKYTTGDLDSRLGYMMNHVLPFQRGYPTLDPYGQPVNRYNGENDWTNLFARIFDDEWMDEKNRQATMTKKLSAHGIIPTRPSRAQDIRENDDELADHERAQDLYLFNEIKGRNLLNLLTYADEQLGGIENAKTEEVQAIYRMLSSKCSTIAKVKVSEMSRFQVMQELGRLKESFEE